MKKTLLIIAALVLALGMTQCKKAEKPQASTGDPIHVTFTATYGGERTTFTPADGSFVWSSGVPEYIYVGGSAHEGCIGTLSAEGNGQSTLTFTGDITPTDGETLHFFYLGKGKDGSEVTSLDFSSQDGTLDNLTDYHIAVGSCTYNGSTDFSATLEPLVAFAYFDLSDFASETIYLHGEDVYATATIDYQTGTIAKETKGYINIGKASASKYVALIPSTENETVLKFDSNSKTSQMAFGSGITASKYYANNGDALSVLATTVSIESDCTIPGLFTVKKNDSKIITKMVRFSKGNLQATGTTASTPSSGWTWSFASHQYDKVGNAVANNKISGNGTLSANGTVDLFGWSTADTYYGIQKYGGSFSGAFVDWGALNIGSDSPNTWHTLSKSEWQYLFNTRTASKVGDTKNARYVKGCLLGTHGVILFPDNYVHPSDVTVPTGINATGNTGWNGNQYNATDWDKMESAGAVFLPAAGYRTSGPTIYSDGDRGRYRSSTKDGDDSAYKLSFESSTLSCGDSNKRSYGYSVRLVRNVN